MTMTAAGSISISSMVQPARLKAEPWPGNPADDPLAAGSATACVIPFARATGRCSLAGCTAVRVRRCGVKSPSSRASFVTSTAPISVSPSDEPASNRPG